MILMAVVITSPILIDMIRPQPDKSSLPILQQTLGIDVYVQE